jgi:hypothetical protein
MPADDASTQIADHAITRAIFLERWGGRIASRMAGVIDAVLADILARLRQDDISTFTRARLEALLVELDTIAEGLDARLLTDLEPELREMVAAEIASNNEAMLAADIAAAVDSLTPEQIYAAALADPMRGRFLSEWFESLEDSLKQKVRDAIRIGYIEGETTDQIAAHLLDLVDARSKRDAQTIVRTAITHFQSRALIEAYKGSPDVAQQYRWLSVLDSRTCVTADTPVMTPDGERPIIDIAAGDWVIGGSGQPRQVTAIYEAEACELIRVTLSNGKTVTCTADHDWLTNRGWIAAGQLIEGEELAGGCAVAQIERIQSADPVPTYDITVAEDESFIVYGAVLHNSTICRARSNRVYKIDQGPLPPAHFGCRSTITPLLKNLPNPEFTSYSEWLERQPHTLQDDILGPTRAKLFRDGGLPLDKFVNDRNGHVYTLEELARREREAWRRAGLDEAA